MSSESVLLEGQGPIAWLRINRPEAHNAFDAEMPALMVSLVRELAADGEARVAIMSGNGPSFCTGLDVKALGKQALDVEWFARWHRMEAELRRLEIPLIVAINGQCLGGGVMLALTGDYRLAADDLRIGFPAVRIGIVPGSGPERLPAMLGAAAARRLCLFGEYLDADEALRIGLVDRIVPAEALEKSAQQLAEKVAGFPPTGLRECKALLAQTLDAEAYERAYLDAQQRCLEAQPPA